MAPFDPFLTPFWKPLFQDYWAFRATLAQKGVKKRCQNDPQNDPKWPGDLQKPAYLIGTTVTNGDPQPGS
jgi:hypothetical protein